MKFTTIIPLKYNDGTPVRPSLLRRLKEDLASRFGGYTEQRNVNGAWADDKGVLYFDESYMISVVCDNERLIEAIRIVRRIGRKLEQKAMYFEVFGYDGVQILRDS